MFELILVQN